MAKLVDEKSAIHPTGCANRLVLRRTHGARGTSQGVAVAKFGHFDPLLAVVSVLSQRHTGEQWLPEQQAWEPPAC